MFRAIALMTMLRPIPTAMWLSNRSLLLILFIFAVYAEEAKIRFLDGSNRPTQDPAKASTRRFLSDAANERCTSIGSTAGALTAKLLIKEGTLIKDEEKSEDDGRATVDLGTFVEMAVSYCGNTLGMDTTCPRPLVIQAAAHMCLAVLCKTPEKQCSAVASASVSEFFSSVRRSMPKATGKKCETMHFRFNTDSSQLFNSNPQGYVRKLTEGVAEMTLETLKIQKKHKEKPIEAPPQATDKNLDYFLSTLTGATIASHISKELVNIGEIKRGRVSSGLDLTKLIGKVVDRIIIKLSFVPKRSTYKVTNAAVKLSLFWLLNNFQVVLKNSAATLTNKTLADLGLVSEDTMANKLKTNSEVVDSKNVYIIVKQQGTKNMLLRKILEKIACDKIRAEIVQKARGKAPDVTSDVIRLIYEPVSSLKSVAVAVAEVSDSTDKVKVGTLPQPQQWYSTKAQADSQKLDVTLTGALAVIIGSHTAEILPKFGLITIDDEPGYFGMESIDIYEIIQEINMKLTAKLMLILPFSLKSGFQIVTGAFKATKFALNLKDLPNDFGRGKSYMYIPLSLKKFGILQFFPDLQHVQLDLIPLPRSNKPLRLWVKPHFDTNVRTLLQNRLESVVEKEITDVLKDVINIFKTKVPGLDIYNLGELQQQLEGIFTWDPPDIMSFIYEPPAADGVLEEASDFREAPKRPLQCPGHYLCSDDLNANIPLYSCTTLDPWCYFPNNFTCPSDIHCPVELTIKGQLIICPDDPSCPVVNIQCPGHSECPDESTTCPGHPSCPLEIKCPGKVCPQRFTIKSQYLMPCPQHPQCNQQPIPNQLVCANAMSCTYSNMIDMHFALQEMEQNIIRAIQSKNVTVHVETKAIANIMIINNQTQGENKALAVNAVATATSSTNGNEEASSKASSSVEANEGSAASAAAAASSKAGGSASAAAASSVSEESRRPVVKGENRQPSHLSTAPSTAVINSGKNNPPLSPTYDKNKPERNPSEHSLGEGISIESVNGTAIGGSTKTNSHPKVLQLKSKPTQGSNQQTKLFGSISSSEGENNGKGGKIAEKKNNEGKNTMAQPKRKVSSEENCSEEMRNPNKQLNSASNASRPASQQELKKKIATTLQLNESMHNAQGIPSSSNEGNQKAHPKNALGSSSQRDHQSSSPSVSSAAAAASSSQDNKNNDSPSSAAAATSSSPSSQNKGSLSSAASAVSSPSTDGMKRGSNHSAQDNSSQDHLKHTPSTSSVAAAASSSKNSNHKNKDSAAAAASSQSDHIKESASSAASSVGTPSKEDQKKGSLYGEQGSLLQEGPLSTSSAAAAASSITDNDKEDSSSSGAAVVASINRPSNKDLETGSPNIAQDSQEDYHKKSASKSSTTVVASSSQANKKKESSAAPAASSSQSIQQKESLSIAASPVDSHSHESRKKGSPNRTHGSSSQEGHQKSSPATSSSAAAVSFSQDNEKNDSPPTSSSAAAASSSQDNKKKDSPSTSSSAAAVSSSKDNKKKDSPSSAAAASSAHSGEQKESQSSAASSADSHSKEDQKKGSLNSEQGISSQDHQKEDSPSSKSTAAAAASSSSHDNKKKGTLSSTAAAASSSSQRSQQKGHKSDASVTASNINDPNSASASVSSSASGSQEKGVSSSGSSAFTSSANESRKDAGDDSCEVTDSESCVKNDENLPTRSPDGENNLNNRRQGSSSAVSASIGPSGALTATVAVSQQGGSAASAAASSSRGKKDSSSAAATASSSKGSSAAAAAASSSKGASAAAAAASSSKGASAAAAAISSSATKPQVTESESLSESDSSYDSEEP